MSDVIKGYKAFNKDMTCQGFQYEEGKEYEMKEGEVELCEKGFHFCENPLDVLSYYDLCESVFAEVESKGKTIGDNKDSKKVTSHIKINLKLSLESFVKASVNFVLDVCKSKPTDEKVFASSGNSAQLASSGDYAKLASSGDYAKLASSGNSAQLASSGDYAKLESSGDYAKLASSGDYAVIAGIGFNNIAKGKKGNWIVLAEWKKNEKINKWIPINVKSVKIDGKKTKEDTYYKLEGGKFQEVL